MTSTPPTTDRERELTEELATLTQMYEVCTRQRDELAAQNEALRFVLQKSEFSMKFWIDYSPPDRQEANCADMDVLLIKEALALPNHAAKILRKRDERVKAEFIERSGKWMTNDAMLKARDARVLRKVVSDWAYGGFTHPIPQSHIRALAAEMEETK